MADSAKQSIIITVSGDRSIHEVAGDLKKAGMNVENVMEVIGTVTGVVDTKTMQKLREVPGIADVSVDHTIDIGPPDAPVQ